MKDYLGTKLEEVYTNAGADGKIMTEDQYLAVRRAIINASEIQIT